VRSAVALAATLAASAAAAPAARVGTAGVTLVLPAGWRTWEPPANVPPVSDPVTRVVAISAPFRFAPGGCQVAAYTFPRDAVAIVVVEWVRPTPHARWPARPGRFTAASLPLRPPPAIECFGGAGGSVEFVDHGRRFGAYLLAGRASSRTLVGRARAVLDTLRVAPR
jgi:hypothetical protein